MRVASWAVDGISYLTTQKSVVDHGLSVASGQDCVMFRLAAGENACRNYAAEDDSFGFKAGGSLYANAPACDVSRIAADLPNRGKLNQCAERLISTYGEGGARDYCERHIVRLLEQRETDEAGVWIGIKVAVVESATTVPELSEMAH